MLDIRGIPTPPSRQVGLRTAFRVFRDLDEALCWARATEPDDA